MGFWYDKTIKPYLFRKDPEAAHHLAVRGMHLASSVQPLCRLLARLNRPGGRCRPIELFGLHFPNAVGLAAGFDKDGVCWPAAAALGFGHVEIGTVTAQRQPGNPRPRVFRYPQEEAVINRMGFNNDGAEIVAQRLARQPRRRRTVPLGINIGKSRAVGIDDAAEDYLASFRALADHADYITINVSSPNTPDLRLLQESSHLAGLLGTLCEANLHRTQDQGKTRVPLLIKIAPDLSYRQIDALLETAADLGLDGVIATNTTLDRPGPCATMRESGGLSGRPLRTRATDIVRYIHRHTEGKLPIIGVGGIHDLEAAGEKMDAGASLVQIYTGMIYQGPFFARDVARALAHHQRADWI